MPPIQRRPLLPIPRPLHPAGPSPEGARGCLETMADLASRTVGKRITLAPASDVSLAWEAMAIHPMNMLETQYQGIVRSTGSDVEGTVSRRWNEEQALSRFFLHNSSQPRLLGPPYGGNAGALPVPSIRSRLRLTRRELADVNAVLRNTDTLGNAGALHRRLQTIRHDAQAILESFFTLPGSAQWGLAFHDDARAQLAAAAAGLARPPTADRLRDVSETLGAVLDAEKRALQGMASVQVSYIDRSHCLFRLSVDYVMDNSTPLSDADITAADRTLTRLLNQDQPWINRWARDKILILAWRLRQLDPAGHIRFFLKGGRALDYLEQTAARAGRGWHAQLLINPRLPPADWYALFLRAQNEVLLSLEAFKREFYVLLQQNAPAFRTSLAAQTKAQPSDSDPPKEEEWLGLQVAEPGFEGMEAGEAVIQDVGYAAPCRAALIAVGLPRRDTVEAITQWDRLHDQILTAPDGVPFPGPIYFLKYGLSRLLQPAAPALAASDENEMAGKDGLLRLYGVLTAPDPRVAAAIAAERAGIPPALAPRSLAAIDAITDNKPLQWLLVLILQQAFGDFGLAAQGDLADAFDAFFAQLVSDMPPKGNGNPVDSLLPALAVAQEATLELTAQQEFRAAFLEQEGAVFNRLVEQAAGLSPRGEAGAFQCVIAGSYATRLHAGYAGVTTDLASISSVDIRAYLNDQAVDLMEALDQLERTVERFLRDHPNTLVPLTPVSGDDRITLRLAWCKPVELGRLTYAPVLAELSMPVPGTPWPPLSYVWGLPVLDLRSLIADYQERAGRTLNPGLRSEILHVIDGLSGLLARTVSAVPANPVVAALAQGLCTHLMVGSSDGTGGSDTLYPPSYYPGEAWRISLPEAAAILEQPPEEASKDVDRTLEILVVNQADLAGLAPSIDMWPMTTAALQLVAPLVGMGVQAKLVVLDFPLSATMLPVLAPLAAPDGLIIANLYGTETIVTPAVWDALAIPLAQRSQPAVRQVLQARLAVMAATLTGRAAVERAKRIDPQDLSDMEKANPASRTPVSLFRCLRPVGDVLADPDAPFDRIDTLVRPLRQQRLPFTLWAEEEQNILNAIPATAGAFTIDTTGTLTRLIRDRVIDVLTGSRYGIGLPSEGLAGLPLFADHIPSLWGMITERWPLVLAQLPGLEACPSPFAVLDARSQVLGIDPAFLGTPDNSTVQILSTINPMALDDVRIQLEGLGMTAKPIGTVWPGT